ncbi:phosphatidylserine lipase ABHD16A [Ascaphus truei]|uniref:phosphatidylserine lipase ABHD16A n=1 Tax=Ascaphus truei TaxID=8439 RepID=UPI003F590860
MAAAGGPGEGGAARRWALGLRLLYRCVRGPRLYRVYRENGRETLRRGRGGAGGGGGGGGGEGGEPAASWESFYQPRGLEKHTDSVLAWVSVLWTISYYCSPLATFYLYRKGYLNMSRLVPLGQYGVTLIFLLAGVACLRGLGRWSNPQYIQFISILERAKKENNAENKKKLSSYNFDFRSWPVDFRWDETSSKDHQGAEPVGGVSLLKPEPGPRGAADSVFTWSRKLPCEIIR